MAKKKSDKEKDVDWSFELTDAGKVDLISKTCSNCDHYFDNDGQAMFGSCHFSVWAAGGMIIRPKVYSCQSWRWKDE